MPDGSLLISDDQAGVVYRVTYRGSRLEPFERRHAAERQQSGCVPLRSAASAVSVQRG